MLWSFGEQIQFVGRSNSHLIRIDLIRDTKLIQSWMLIAWSIYINWNMDKFMLQPGDWSLQQRLSVNIIKRMQFFSHNCFNFVINCSIMMLVIMSMSRSSMSSMLIMLLIVVVSHIRLIYLINFLKYGNFYFLDF
jgi:hypothetical protein